METTIAAAAAVAALASALFVWVQVREMQQQTALQREVREAAEQPYVYADVNIAQPNGWNLELIIGNSGPTVATNVRVAVDPPFRAAARVEPKIDEIHQRLAAGIASLPPGRRLFWTLGPSAELLSGDGPFAHTVTIDCDGPFGRVTTTEYIIDLDDMRDSRAKRNGSLHEISASIDKLTDKVTKGMRRLEEPEEDPE